MEDKTINRRNFIQLSTRILLYLAGLLGLGGLIRFLSHKTDSGPPSSYQLGLAVDFPINGKMLRLDIPAVIYHLNGEYLAYSLRCTHLGCTLEENGVNFSCPCHGSEFDQNGRVLKGPADQSLPKFNVDIDQEGNLILDTREGGK